MAVSGRPGQHWVMRPCFFLSSLLLLSHAGCDSVGEVSTDASEALDAGSRDAFVGTDTGAVDASVEDGAPATIDSGPPAQAPIFSDGF